MDNENKKGCTQINVPVVDNTSNCENFSFSECVIVNRKSRLFNNVSDDNLNEYLDLLEQSILKMQNTIRLLNIKFDAIKDCCNGGGSGIGTF